MRRDKYGRNRLDVAMMGTDAVITFTPDKKKPTSAEVSKIVTTILGKQPDYPKMNTRDKMKWYNDYYTDLWTDIEEDAKNKKSNKYLFFSSPKARRNK